MKIVNLKIKNIASLKGEHIIDFDKILTHSGVFAITGETGSGKSTILNCISLALYGQNYKKANKQKDFVTLGESVGEIELTYKVRNTLYKAYWYLRLKKNDGSYLKNSQQERRFELHGENGWETTNNSPEETINLNFDQFTKTIVLNQGEFAKFLTSGFKERKDILAKLYEGERLEQLSIHVRRKITKTKNQIELFNSHVQGINENTNFNLEEAKKLVADKKDKLLQLKEASTRNKEVLDYLIELKKLKEQYNKNQSIIQNIEKRLVELTKQENDLKRELKEKEEHLAHAAKTYDKEAPKLIECIGQQKILIDKQSSLKQEIDLSSKISDSITTEKKHIQTLQDHNKALTEQIKKINLDERCKNISSNSIEKLDIATKSLKDSRNKQELFEKEIQIIKQDIISIEKKADELKSSISTDNEKNLEEVIHESQQKLDETVKQKEEYSLAYNSLISYQKNQIKLNQELKSNKDLLEKNDKEINILGKDLPELQVRLQEQELALQSFSLKEHLQAVTLASLEQGECLVCHNKDIKELKTFEIDNSQKSQLNARFKSTQNEIKNIEVKIQGLRSSQAHFRATEIQIQNKLREEISALINQFSFIQKDELEKAPDKLAKEIEANIAKNNQVITELKNKLETDKARLVKIKELSKQLDDLRKEYSLKSKSLEETQSKEKATKNVIDSLSKEIKSLLNFEIQDINLTQLISDLKEYHYCIQRLKDNQNASFKSQETLNNLLTDKEKCSLKCNELKTQIANITEFIKENTQGDPQTELNTLKAQVDASNKTLTQTQRSLNDLKVTLAEETSKDKNYKEQCEQIDHLYKVTSVDMINLTSSPLEFEHLTHNIELKKTIIDFFQKLSVSTTVESIDPAVLLETVNFSESLITKIIESINKLSESIIKNEVLINKKLEAQDKIKSIQTEIDQLNEQKSQLENLYDLVGKDEFRNFVLSLIEKNLIIQTNHELKNLCNDRYVIQHFSKNVQSMPDFYVVDKYRAGLTRKVSTLSGGETFMVSLAMALALAELTRGSSEVDSFFIDEGFGTLDEDSLEDVLDMISTMEQRGKSIGLISHIKKLTDRMSVNIFLKKSELGNSTINVKYN